MLEGSTVAAFVHFLNSFLMIAIPLALGVFLARRLGLAWSLFGIGAATFAISQVFHLPFNAWVLAPALERLGMVGNQQGVPPASSLLLYGISAGVFEEGARYLTYRFWLRRSRDWKHALMFGAGHGGFEAILLGLVALYAFFQALALREADLSAIVPPEHLILTQQQLQLYWAAPWHASLLGALERALTICLHIALAAIVLQAITRRNLLWLGLAVAWHALANTCVLLVYSKAGAYAAEGLLAIVALLSLAALLALRRKPMGPSLPSVAPRTATRVALENGPGPEDLPPERLEESRYADD
jgi:uncharacterized membrane protein YhfC